MLGQHFKQDRVKKTIAVVITKARNWASHQNFEILSEKLTLPHDDVTDFGVGSFSASSSSLRPHEQSLQALRWPVEPQTKKKSWSCGFEWQWCWRRGSVLAYGDWDRGFDSRHPPKIFSTSAFGAPILVVGLFFSSICLSILQCPGQLARYTQILLNILPSSTLRSCAKWTKGLSVSILLVRWNSQWQKKVVGSAESQFKRCCLTLDASRSKLIFWWWAFPDLFFFLNMFSL